MEKLTKSAMADGIRESRFVILFLSEGVLTRPYVQFELEEAMAASKQVLLLHEQGIKVCCTVVRNEFPCFGLIAGSSQRTEQNVLVTPATTRAVSLLALKRHRRTLPRTKDTKKDRSQERSCSRPTPHDRQADSAERLGTPHTAIRAEG